jgi:hypothetical protein
MLAVPMSTFSNHHVLSEALNWAHFKKTQKQSSVVLSQKEQCFGQDLPLSDPLKQPSCTLLNQ